MSDLAITEASVLPSTQADIRSAIAAQVILAGSLIAINADGTASLATATGLAPLSTPKGIACCTAEGIGQIVTYTDVDPLFNPGATTTSGMPYFLSVNAGKICPAADLTTSTELVSLIGFGAPGNLISVIITPSGQAVP
jgi:hypothetical protein